MFKYGSLRLFLLKFTTGLIFSIFSVVVLLSLLSYNVSDPGFKKISAGLEQSDIINFFGYFGAYLSSYLLVFLGHGSYILFLCIFVIGIKFLIGLENKFFILKIILNLLGLILLNFFLSLFDVSFYSIGIIPLFFINFFYDYFNTLFNKEYINYLINFIFLILGFYLIVFSFSAKMKYFVFLLKIVKIINLFKFLKIFIFFFKSKKIIKSKNLNFKKNEPTLQRKSFFNLNKTNKKIEKKSRQLEIDQFRFNLPSSDLISRSIIKTSYNKELEKINKEASSKLEKTLLEYGVEGKIVNYKFGPIVTLFEFVPNAGIKSSKIIGLSDDIARAMSSISARISSQPGKTSLGIEIPNKKREGVFFGDLIEDEEFKNSQGSLTLALGRDISGEKVFADLEKMPHLLIAGTTGSGKSVGINTMILSLLFKFKPNECKLILIDPKMLELSIYEDIPHLLTPVVTDPKKAVFALKWVVREMENRYKLMSSVNVKNINSYNNKVLKNISTGKKLFREVQTGVDSDTRMPIVEKKEIPLEKMPFIVVVIDEMADLMMVAGKEVESLVQRLAQMARASGIHMITATQRPSVDVITGTIKANFPSRISYKVASKFDSRTILNEMGAEQLLGSGDMLFLENGVNVKRLHGGFVSEGEAEKIVSFIKSQATFDHKKEISIENVESNLADENSLISSNTDDLYSKAVDIVIKQQKVSTSYIQRYLQIGYNRAARIVEKMEEDGIITEANNAGKRHVIKKN